MTTAYRAETWNALIAALPGVNILQTWQWAQLKAPLGWRALPQVWWDEAHTTPLAAAMCLFRPIPIVGMAARLGVMYVPRGPLLDWGDATLRRRVLTDLHQLAQRQGAMFIKIDPPLSLGRGVPGSPEDQPDPLGQTVLAELAALGWHASEEQIQFRNTMLIDLRPEEDAILAAMKQKGRYNIRLAERKGVQVQPVGAEALPDLYRLYAETSARDGFVIREEAYYLRLWQTMLDAGMAEPLLATVEGELVAGVVVLRFAGVATYLHGMSRQAQREKMPNHLLQWEAMRRARAAGCHTYDLWGAPDVFDESDDMWGVFRFKDSLGGVVQRGPGAWDLPVRPLFYRLYTNLLPRLLDLMRRRGRARTARIARQA